MREVSDERMKLAKEDLFWWALVTLLAMCGNFGLLHSDVTVWAKVVSTLVFWGVSFRLGWATGGVLTELRRAREG